MENAKKKLNFVCQLTARTKPIHTEHNFHKLFLSAKFCSMYQGQQKKGRLSAGRHQPSGVTSLEKFATLILALALALACLPALKSPARIDCKAERWIGLTHQGATDEKRRRKKKLSMRQVFDYRRRTRHVASLQIGGKFANARWRRWP